MTISLFVLVDKDNRILYSGSNSDCYQHMINGLYKDCTIVLLQGVL